MKKQLIIITSFILLCIMIVGCQTTNATINASTELNKNLNLLSNTVTRLDTIDNEYLVNNEIYTLNNSTPTQKISRKNTLNNNPQILDAEKISLNDDLRQALSNELINRIYCDENGNCKLCDEKFICNDNNMCNSCNQTIICDENGNCTSCGDTLIIDNNNCNSCKTTCISSEPNNKIDSNTKNLLQKISSNNKNLDVQLLSSSTTSNNNNETSDANISYDNNINEKDIDNNANNTTNTNNETNSNYSLIFYAENSYVPNLKYRPRFANNINYDSSTNNFNNYIEKLQKLYTMTADVVEANNTLSDYKILILDNINETKELNNCIINGNCNPNSQQVIALNNYIEDIKNTVSNLRRCNGNLTNEINKISSMNTGITQSLDITNSNYLRILNQIDTRISYHENAVATLEQIKYLLQDAQNNPVTPDIEVEDLITNDHTEGNNTNDNSTDRENNEIIENHDIDLNENTNNSEYDSNNAYSNNQTSSNDVVIIPEDNYNETIINDHVENNNLTNEATNTTANEEDTTDTEITNTNVDTYQENPSNLDLTTNDENIDNDILDNNESIVNNNDELNVNNNIVSNTNNTPQMVDGTINNNYNSENTGHDNSIITQNNLNNNNIGNNSYRYDEDGDLYNNTNGYNNSNINNINERNNNVNTYKYNTLIDSINRGTINNGINNL